MIWTETEAALSWGRRPKARHAVARPAFGDEAFGLLDPAGPPVLPRGLGRSYGDSGLNADGRLIDMTGLDRFISADWSTGKVRAQAGLSLEALINAGLWHGWFPATVPGTRYVTLGGAVANDIHGKNHHGAGTFGSHVTALHLLRSDGSPQRLTPDDPLFAATVGGLGLTGLITEVELQLGAVPSGWIDTIDVPFDTVEDFFALSAAAEGRYEHTVAWVDVCGVKAGRGIFSQGNWAARAPREIVLGPPARTMPFEAPGFALNPLTLQAFNALYYRAKALKGRRMQRVRADAFWFPLDAIGHWNRMYGPRGFYQYQCVVPPQAAVDATKALLKAIADARQGSFLAVLKTFGDRPSPGLLSFPMPGATLALDFPDKGEETLALFARLDAIVAEAGGRLYPAKDGRMPADMFRRGFPRWEEVEAQRDPAIMSDFWRRVTR